MKRIYLGAKCSQDILPWSLWIIVAILALLLPVDFRKRPFSKQISHYLSKSEGTDAPDWPRVKTQAHFYREQVRLPRKAGFGPLKWQLGSNLQWSVRWLSENHDFRQLF